MTDYKNRQMAIDNINARINLAWKNDSAKVDWLELEKVQRDILRAWKNLRIDAVGALEKLDEALAAFTKRGRSI